MESISSRIAKVSPSLTLAVTAQAKAMIAKGEEVYALAGGEPEVDTPQFIKDAAIAALQAGKTKYTQAGGIPELRAALSNKFAVDNQLTYAANQICVTGGAKMACRESVNGRNIEMMVFRAVARTRRELLSETAKPRGARSSNDSTGFGCNPTLILDSK